MCGFIPDHHRGGPEIPCLHTIGLCQNPPDGVPSVSVPTGLSRHSHQLQLRLHKKKTKQTENSARMHSVEGNNNLIYGMITVPALPIGPMPAPHTFLRSDALLNPEYGRSAIGAERPILIPSSVYRYVVGCGTYAFYVLG